MLEAIADKRRPVGDCAKEIERADPAFEELHDSLLLTPAVPVRWRDDVDMVREFRADFRSPLFTVQTAHGVSPPRLEHPYVLVSFLLSSGHFKRRFEAGESGGNADRGAIAPLLHFWKIDFGSIAWTPFV